MRYSIAAALLAFLMASPVLAKQYPLGKRSILSDRAVAQRVEPVGELCVKGEPCATRVASASGGGSTSASSGARSGKTIVNKFCSTCHVTGVLGAPVVGKKSDWKARIEKGMDTLFKHAWNGYNAMPPKGTCSNCTKKEIRAAVKYMVEQVQ